MIPERVDGWAMLCRQNKTGALLMVGTRTKLIIGGARLWMEL